MDRATHQLMDQLVAAVNAHEERIKQLEEDLYEEEAEEVPEKFEIEEAPKAEPKKPRRVGRPRKK